MPNPSGTWVPRAGRASVVVDKRAMALFVALASLLALVTVASLCLGGDSLSPRTVFATFLDAWRKAEPGVSSLILFEIRLPRVFAASVAGFAMGLAGCLSQTVFRNRLATPDVLGINEGAALAIVAFVLLTATASWPLWLAPVGALLAVALLHAATSSNKESGATLLVSGLCLVEFLRAVVEFLMSMGALHEVQSIYVWMHGSFIGQGYSTSLPVLGILAASAPAQAWLAHQIEMMRLSPDLARGLGYDVATLRRVAVAAVAVLAAVGASIGGPVAFVALAAPLLVARVLSGRTAGYWCSGLVGSILLQVSDSLARVVADPKEIAAGVVTRCLGGAFLVLLLLRDRKR